MKKGKVVFKLCGRIALAVVVVALAVCVPMLKIKERNDNLNNVFFGETAEYQGVLELWHIETFEGGLTSRSSWLEKRAIEFEKQNKGLYILVKTMSVSEMENSLNAGMCPDLFSFSKGVEDVIQGKLANIDSSLFNNVNASLLQSGSVNGVNYAIPFCYSGYVLISTSEKLSKSSLSVSANVLSDNIFNTGYVKSLRKKDVNIYSCVYGGSGATSPNVILSNLKLEQSELSINPNSSSFSSYDAYCDFISNNSNILLGTLRDVARVESKVQTGSFADVIIEPISDYTDMVCYLGYSSQNGELRAKYALKYIQYCLSETSQQKVAALGLLSPTINSLYENGVLALIESVFRGGINCPNLFE